MCAPRAAGRCIPAESFGALQLASPDEAGFEASWIGIEQELKGFDGQCEFVAAVSVRVKAAPRAVDRTSAEHGYLMEEDT